MGIEWEEEDVHELVNVFQIRQCLEIESHIIYSCVLSVCHENVPQTVLHLHVLHLLHELAL